MSAPPLGSPATGPGAPAWRLARVLRVTVAKLLLAIFRVRVIGIENVPAEGGYILAGNHVSHLDPILLWCAAPRPAHFIAKSELFDKKFVGWLIRRVWAFPINRGSADREAIQRATDLLVGGESVGIFPEGTRHRSEQTADDELGTAHAGVAFIATRANAPVVPVGIAGTAEALPVGASIPRPRRVTMCFGQPVCPSDFSQGGRKERMTAMTAEIMRRIGLAIQTAEEA